SPTTPAPMTTQSTVSMRQCSARLTTPKKKAAARLLGAPQRNTRSCWGQNQFWCCLVKSWRKKKRPRWRRQCRSRGRRCPVGADPHGPFRAPLIKQTVCHVAGAAGQATPHPAVQGEGGQ